LAGTSVRNKANSLPGPCRPDLRGLARQTKPIGAGAALRRPYKQSQFGERGGPPYVAKQSQFVVGSPLSVGSGADERAKQSQLAEDETNRNVFI
jgi:hypothetical protein